jgi:hypothetical protein
MATKTMKAIGVAQIKQSASMRRPIARQIPANRNRFSDQLALNISYLSSSILPLSDALDHGLNRGNQRKGMRVDWL